MYTYINPLPELTRDERRALLDRAVEEVFASQGAPSSFEDQIQFDLSVNLRFCITEMLERECRAAEVRYVDSWEETWLSEQGEL